MPQSTLYKRSSAEAASTVDVTSDPARDLGVIDVAELNDTVALTEDANRALGQVSVTNDLGIAGQVGVDIEAQTTGALTTDIAEALSGNVLRVGPGGSALDVSAAPLGLKHSNGNQINPMTDTTGNRIIDRLTSRPNVAFGADEVTTPGTPVSLNGGTSQPVGGQMAVAVQGLPGNSGPIYIGDDTVTAADGFPVQPGQIATVAVDDVSTISVDADNAGDEARWLVEVA